MQIEVQQLRDLIGTGVIYRGMACCVVEVLEDGPALVLENPRARTLQADQYSEPGRTVPETYTVPVHTVSGNWHEEFLALRLPVPPSPC